MLWANGLSDQKFVHSRKIIKLQSAIKFDQKLFNETSSQIKSGYLHKTFLLEIKKYYTQANSFPWIEKIIIRLSRIVFN